MEQIQSLRPRLEQTPSLSHTHTHKSNRTQGTALIIVNKREVSLIVAVLLPDWRKLLTCAVCLLQLLSHPNTTDRKEKASGYIFVLYRLFHAVHFCLGPITICNVCTCTVSLEAMICLYPRVYPSYVCVLSFECALLLMHDTEVRVTDQCYLYYKLGVTCVCLSDLCMHIVPVCLLERSPPLVMCGFKARLPVDVILLIKKRKSHDWTLVNTAHSLSTSRIVGHWEGERAREVE